ncbi:hypothetical protein QCA50_004452 [Cerrena zonata]|uniref:Response regulatory domain-containing protein n=1 Tax=Cerrena zonata TaxID=2478898 RepID=A0AAW0GSA3_9APHY
MVTPSYRQTATKNDKQTQSTTTLLDYSSAMVNGSAGNTTLPGLRRSSTTPSSSRHGSPSPAAPFSSSPARDSRRSGSNKIRRSLSPHSVVKALPRIRRTSSTSISSDDTLCTESSFLTSCTSSPSLPPSSLSGTPSNSNSSSSSNSSISPQPESKPKQPPTTTTPSMRSSRSAKVVSPTLRWAVPPRVLLVDDDVVYRMLSGKLLQVFGCMIDIAVDGAAAVSKMNLEKYDLVFMDIMMPKLDGLSATSLIRQFDHLTPIISVTSNYQPDEVVAYYSSGMNDVLPKPFTRDGVHGILEKHLVHLKAIQTAVASTSSSPHYITTPPPTPVPFTIPPLSQRLASPLSAVETLQTLPIMDAVAEKPLSVSTAETFPVSVSAHSQPSHTEARPPSRSPSPMTFAYAPPLPSPLLLSSLPPSSPSVPTGHDHDRIARLSREFVNTQDETTSAAGLKRSRDCITPPGQPERKRSVKKPRGGESLDVVAIRGSMDSASLGSS